MSRETKGCCSCGCLFSTAISAIFIWLAFRILTPTCTIVEFDVFVLQKSNNNNNHTIHYDLKLKNRNFNKGIYYDALNLTFFYKPNVTSYHIADFSRTPFYQGFWKTAHVVGDVESIGVNLGNGTTDNGVAEFRVEMKTNVRYRYPLWKTKRHSLVVGGNVKVNGQGKLDKGVVLNSAHGRMSKGSFELVSILGILYLICFV